MAQTTEISMKISRNFAHEINIRYLGPKKAAIEIHCLLLWETFGQIGLYQMVSGSIHTGNNLLRFGQQAIFVTEPKQLNSHMSLVLPFIGMYASDGALLDQVDAFSGEKYLMGQKQKVRVLSKNYLVTNKPTPRGKISEATVSSLTT